MDKLDLILRKLEALEEGQKELNQISRAIRDHQEETDAKLEAVAMDVHKLQGKVEEQNEKLNAVSNELHIFRRETKSNFRQLEGHMRMLDNDLDEAIERIDQLESHS
ncbi:hypothetical protein [Paenibacillus sp. J2TS4]|uniref:hypothetical protein n=1 Tax=Paenibacillus sp. J2TS4 TaxID=2807194 RepID=UPI001B1B71D0|nr:hypothetical protein [Paenibacillus sp. J2TS4]GIP31982.1 hypothetical protein J2TS4_11920 [Paenibacillus sp. J2TS4]